jgi:hypothetical protein
MEISKDEMVDSNPQKQNHREDSRAVFDAESLRFLDTFQVASTFNHLKDLMVFAGETLNGICWTNSDKSQKSVEAMTASLSDKSKSDKFEGIFEIEDEGGGMKDTGEGDIDVKQLEKDVARDLFRINGERLAGHDGGLEKIIQAVTQRHH